MTSLAQGNPSKFVGDFSKAMPGKQAWAAYVRRAFVGENLSKAIQSAWDLTEAEAKGIVYGTISQNTIDKIKGFVGPYEAWRLTVEVTAIETGVAIEHFIKRQEQRARDAIALHQAEERRLAALRSRLPVCGLGGLDGHPKPRNRRAGDAAVVIRARPRSAGLTPASGSCRGS